MTAADRGQGSPDSTNICSIPPGGGSLLGMARPSTGACALEDARRAAGRYDGPPHPTRGLRLPVVYTHVYEEGPSPMGQFAPGYRTQEGYELEPGDLLCTPCYRREFALHHGYDPIVGPTVPRWLRRRSTSRRQNVNESP